MAVFLKTKIGVDRFRESGTLGEGAQRQQLPEPAKVDEALSKTLDEYFPKLDETQYDGAANDPGTVRYHTPQGQRISVSFEGDSKQGSYTQEYVGGGFIFTEFKGDVVESLAVTPGGVKHLHVDRSDPSRSFVEFMEGPWNVYGELPPAPNGPPQADNLVKTVTGLSYAVLAEGQGEPAQPGDQALVHYTGWLKDGTKFDSSVDRKEPFEFQLGAGQVIAGWDQGVAGMRPGEKRLLVIPPELGYGERGAGSAIPPGAELLFQVELVAAGRS